MRDLKISKNDAFDSQNGHVFLKLKKNWFCHN